jgi:hypothetical protein
MANLKAIMKIYLRRPGVLLRQVECRICPASIWPIKEL